MTRLARSRFALAFATLVATSLGGCAGGAERFIAETRIHQGDVAYAHTNYKDAEAAYRLALQVAPDDLRAREGFVSAQIKLADLDFHASKFEAALDELAVAAKYSPDNVRVEALRNEIQQAKVKEAIVLSNYPLYRQTGLALRREYAALRVQSGTIVATLQEFDYTNDAGELTKAIQQSFELETEVKKLTTRLTNYRQLVESGAPDRESSLAPAASLLPLP